MVACIFCGKDVRKASRSKEHIIPMWLLRATGDPHRKICIEFDPDTGADVIRPASTFHFPACADCNQNYGEKLETHAKAAMEALSSGRSLTVSQCYRLLDWLDKIRVGLWLGYHMLHREVFVPKFRIAERIGKKDRVAIISVDPNDNFKGFSIGGCDDNVFRTSQAAVYLRVNNVRIISVSYDSVTSSFSGVPYIKELFSTAQNLNLHVRNLEIGDYTLKQDWQEFLLQGATVLAQPVCWPGTTQKRVIDIFFNHKMMRRFKDAPRISKPEHLDRFYPMQLISNASGRSQYYPVKRKRICFGKGEYHDDAVFMSTLYMIMLKRVLPIGPTKVIHANGKSEDIVVLVLLQAEKILQILFRLNKLGTGDAKMTDEMIDLVCLLTRMREEILSHIGGSCYPSGDDFLVS